MKGKEVRQHLWQYFKSHVESIGQRKEKRMGWLCSYTPVEILSAAGFQPYRVYGEEKRGFLADSYLQANLCSYARCVLEWGLEKSKELGGLVVVNSCNAMGHLFHNWERYCSVPFYYCLDLPRTRDRNAIYYFKQNLRQLVCALEKFQGRKIESKELRDQIELYHNLRTLSSKLLNLPQKEKVSAGIILYIVRHIMQLPADDAISLINNILAGAVNLAPCPQEGPRVFLAGGMMEGDLAFKIEEMGGVIAGDDLCTGSRYYCGFPPAGGIEEINERDPLEFLAGHYLGRQPCARMKAGVNWTRDLVEKVRETRAEGVIFYALKFCDPWHYEGQVVKKALEGSGIPVLILEGEYGTGGGGGQVLTRIQAFLEMITR